MKEDDDDDDDQLQLSGWRALKLHVLPAERLERQ